MSFSIATFNVLDRFDAVTLSAAIAGPGVLDPARRRDAEQAGERLYRAKVRATASAVRRLDADVIAFQEVQSAGVLDDVRAQLPHSGGYLPAIAAPSDKRGIACGLLTRLPVQRVTHHSANNLPFPALFEGDPLPFVGRLSTRRGVLEVVLTLPDNSPLHVLVVHFKSKLPSALVRIDGTSHPIATMRDLVEGQIRAEISRIAEALHLRSIIDQRLDENADIQLLAAGDFNDTPDSLTVRVVTGDPSAAALAAYDQATVNTPTGLANRALFSCIRGLRGNPAETIEWNGMPETIDHLLVTESLWSRFKRAEIHNERLTEISAALGQNVEGSLDSDHAPLLAHFV